ncbi:MAG TPA: hypothetical protein PKX56_05255, partial [Marmoricola sp.]|nr:hypothetical protein [Marmoricola sp.]
MSKGKHAARHRAPRKSILDAPKAALIGAPVLSDVVDLERRAGSLDLALSSPGADLYFERRLLAFLSLL